MNGSGILLTVLRRIVVAAPLLLVVVALDVVRVSKTQFAKAADRVPNERLENTTQGSRSSFNLPHSQPVIQSMEIIHESIGRNDYAGVLPLMERVLSEPNSFVPTGESTQAASHEEIRRLFRKIPADQKRRFDEQRSVRARAVWERVRGGTVADVAAFMEQFGDLSIGAEAWWWLGRHELDCGRNTQAAAAFSRLAEHPKATGQQRAMAIATCIEILANSNRMSEVSPFLDRLKESDREIGLGIGGQSITLGRWLDKHRFDSRLHDVEKPIPQSTSAAATFRRVLPVPNPTWSQELPVLMSENLDSLELKQRAQGIRPVPMNRPLVVNQRIIVRTLEDIQAFELSTGKPLWKIPNSELKSFDKRTVENGVFMSVATGWAQRRTEADSNFGSLSTDGIRLFAIQEPNRQREFPSDHAAGAGNLRTGPRNNNLCCYSLETGVLEWETGGTLATGNDLSGNYFFLGGPLLMDDGLYVAAQRGSELFLMALDRVDGHPMWTMNLGTVSLPIQDDLQRSRVACPIVWHDGLIVCSTGAGVVVAIDPILRSLQWGYRYAATTVSVADLARAPNQSESSVSQEIWWKSWRRPFSAVSQLRQREVVNGQKDANLNALKSSILIFASPETDLLHAIRLPGGEPLWQVPRNLGLFVAGIDDGAVVVIEGDFARAHELDTGKLRWRTATGEIGGPGTLIGSVLVLPVRAGGTISLDIGTGRILSEPMETDLPLGVLTDSEPGWIACSRQTVMLLPRLEETRERLVKELQSDPDNESLRVSAAFLDLQAGDTTSANKCLEGLESPSARDLRRQILIAVLGKNELDRSGQSRAELARELSHLADNPERKYAAAAAIGSSALMENDLVSTVIASLDGLSADLDQFETLVNWSSVKVRKDRVLLGMIDEAYRRAKPVDLGLLDNVFYDRIRDARTSRDKFAIHDLAQQWRGIDWARRLVVTDEEKVFRKRTSNEIEIRLLDAAGSNDSTIAVQALERLAQRFDRLAAFDDARAIRQRILNELPLATFPDGQTEGDRIANDSRLRNTVFGPPKSAWPDVEPHVEPRVERNTQIYCPMVPIHAEPGSLCERLDVCVDRAGTDVVFRGESFFQSGQDEDHERRFPLPKSQSVYRGSTGYMLREGWAVGRIVVLQVGSELFAIPPLDDRGEPNSQKFAWSIDLQMPVVDSKVIPGRLGAQDERHVVVDETNRQLASVGPVRAGYLCYQKGAKLVAIETETGRELWQRLDLPDDATVLGDDHYVYVWRESKVVEILSAIDGRKLEERASFGSPSSMIHHRGSLVWTETRANELKLELHDLRTGGLIWARSEPPDSLVKTLDPETLAIMRTDGTLHILAARTASPVCEPIAVDSAAAVEMVVWYDPERWYIALSRAVNDLAYLKRFPQPYNSYRLKFVNGPLYALNRQSPRIVWKKEIVNEPMALDQSRAAPVLVQLWNMPSGRANDGNKGKLRVIDKRTGKVLFEKHSAEILPYFLLNPDHQQAILELKLTRETIRFSYSADPPADAVEAVLRASDK